jgi:hypothetical protein
MYTSPLHDATRRARATRSDARGSSQSMHGRHTYVRPYVTDVRAGNSTVKSTTFCAAQYQSRHTTGTHSNTGLRCARCRGESTASGTHGAVVRVLRRVEQGPPAEVDRRRHLVVRVLAPLLNERVLQPPEQPHQQQRWKQHHEVCKRQRAVRQPLAEDDWAPAPASSTRSAHVTPSFTATTSRRQAQHAPRTCLGTSM